MFRVSSRPERLRLKSKSVIEKALERSISVTGEGRKISYYHETDGRVVENQNSVKEVDEHHDFSQHC